MRLLRMLLMGVLLVGAGSGLAACKEGGYTPPAQDWPPRRTPGGHD